LECLKTVLSGMVFFVLAAEEVETLRRCFDAVVAWAYVAAGGVGGLGMIEW